MAQTLVFPHFNFLIIRHVHGYIKQRDFQLSPFCLFLEVSFWSWGKKGECFPGFCLVPLIFLCSASEAIIVPPPPPSNFDWEVQGQRNRLPYSVLILWPCFQTSGACLDWCYQFLTAIFLPEHLLIIQLSINKAPAGEGHLPMPEK